MSPLSHTIAFLFSLSTFFVSLFFTFHSIISVVVLNLFIARLTLLWCILLTARAEAEQTETQVSAFLNTRYIDGASQKILKFFNFRKNLIKKYLF